MPRIALAEGICYTSAIHLRGRALRKVKDHVNN